MQVHAQQYRLLPQGLPLAWLAGGRFIAILSRHALGSPRRVASLHVLGTISMFSTLDFALPRDLFIGKAATLDLRAEDDAEEEDLEESEDLEVESIPVEPIEQVDDFDEDDFDDEFDDDFEEEFDDDENAADVGDEAIESAEPGEEEFDDED
jgi:hypothetical protein